MRIVARIIILLSVMALGNISDARPVANYFDLTEIGTSAGTIRKGDIQGFSSTATGIFENPASIYRTYKLSASAFMTEFMEEASYQNIALAMRMPIGVIGLGVMRLGVDDLYKTKEENGRHVTNGTFNYDNTLYKIAYQVSHSRYLHIGIAANLYSTRMDTVKGDGYNIDLGAVFDGENIDVSIAMKNIMTSSVINYSDSDPDPDNNSNGQIEALPLISTLGVRYHLKYLGLYGQVKKIGESRKFVKNFGVDAKIPFISIIEFSGGYREYYKNAVNIEGETSEKVIKSATIGVGLDLFGVNFDYAFEKTMDDNAYSEYQQKHYFSVGLSF